METEGTRGRSVGNFESVELNDNCASFLGQNEKVELSFDQNESKRVRNMRRWRFIPSPSVFSANNGPCVLADT